MPHVALRDVASSIQAGYQFRERVEHDPTGNVGVLQVKDVRESIGQGIARLVRVRMELDVVPYVLRDGDVLFLSRGHRLFATVVREPPPQTVAPNYFYIIRVRREVVSPDYLAWYLNQPAAQARLAPLKAGTHMPIVSKSDFEQIQIPVPPLDVQRAVVSLADLARREQELMGELREARQQLIESVCMRAVKRPTTEGK